MRDLFIVGAGGFGREAVWTVERINGASPEPPWRVIGFADDDPAKSSGNFEGYPMLGTVEKASADNPGASVFIAIGDNRIRRDIYRRLRGHDFPALIDPAAQVSPTTEFKHGTYIAVEAVVSVGTDIGKFVIINARAGVGHDSTVGDFANIAPGVSLSGHSKIGQDVFMGTNSCTAPGMSVGDGATVACGTPVLKDVAPGTTLSPFGTLRA
ncbi:MAG: NeuD/PglB/VioB family sugar acetyltransferase [Kiritimatiellae bacterium]|nr:NeuD/PglB/VioB family sugar acetyltransferase [Kiritimatiellia bacterium]